MEKKCLLVIGRSVLDFTRLVLCNRRDQTDSNVPVLDVVDSLPTKAGGAANAAACAHVLGLETTLITADGPKSEIQRLLANEYGSDIRISAGPHVDDLAKKYRLRWRHTGSLTARFDEPERCRSVTSLTESIIDRFYVEVDARKPDIILVSDYGGPACADAVLDSVFYWADKHGIEVLVDPCFDGLQTTVYDGASIVMPSAEQLGDPASPNSIVARYADMGIAQVVMTQGARGITVWDRFRGEPIQLQAPRGISHIDSCGCGDAFAAAMCFGRIHNLAGQTLYALAQGAGAAAAQHIGVAQPSLLEAFRIGTRDIPTLKFTSLNMMLQIAAQVPVAVANGVFDMTHAGHMDLFAQLREHVGKDMPIFVLVNSDASLTALERSASIPGDTRESMVALSTNVDAVTQFDEATPIELIRAMKPACLAKGPDYTEDQVVGREYAKSIFIAKERLKVHSSDIRRV